MKKRMVTLFFTVIIFFPSVVSKATYSSEYEVINSLNLLPSETQNGKIDMRIKGRTLVNMLGDDGNCEDANDVMYSTRCTTEVNSGRFKHITTEAERPSVRLNKYYVDSTKYYLFMTDVENNTTSAITSRLVNTQNNYRLYGSHLQSVASGETGTIIRKYAPTDLETLTNGQCSVEIYIYDDTCEIGDTFYSDNWVLCEISEEDYYALSPEQLLEKYNYISGIQGTNNFRVKSVGANILDSEVIYHMSNAPSDDGNITLGTDNSLIFTSTAFDAWTKTVSWDTVRDYQKQYLIRINPDSTLYYSRHISGLTSDSTDEYIHFYDKNYNYLKNERCDAYSGYVKDVIDVPSEAHYMTLRVGADAANQTVTFSEIMFSYADIDYEPYKESVSYIPYTLFENEEITIEDLIAYPNGTISIDCAVKEQNIYGDEELTINNSSLPIDYVESVYKIEGYKRTVIDMCNVSFTDYTIKIDGAEYGDIYEYAYLYQKGHMALPIMTYSCPIDDESYEEATLDLINNNSNEIDDLYAEIALLKQQLGNINTQPISITSEENKEYNIVLTGINAINTSTRTFYVYYDPDKLEVVDLCGATSTQELGTGVVSGTDITITQFMPTDGKIEFKIDCTTSMAWSGVVNVIKFEGKVSGESTSITYTVQ